MSLREKLLLRARVAALPCIEMQPCNSPPNNATSDATPAQLTATNAHEIGLSFATAGATPVQPYSCREVKKTPSKVALSYSQIESDVPTPLSDVKLLEQLHKAAERCCDYWNDSPAARAEMVADIKATPSNRRQELLEHFLAAYGKAK